MTAVAFAVHIGLLRLRQALNQPITVRGAVVLVVLAQALHIVTHH